MPSPVLPIEIISSIGVNKVIVVAFSQGLVDSLAFEIIFSVAVARLVYLLFLN